MLESTHKMNGNKSFIYRTCEHLQGINVMLRNTSVDRLKDFCSDCENLYTALAQYTCSIEIQKIMDTLDENDALCDFADENNMNVSDMEQWILSNLDSSVECRTFREHGPFGSWPVVEIKCLDKVFYLDWITD